LLRVSIALVLLLLHGDFALRREETALEDRCFPESTGRCIGDRFFQHWLATGGLARHGYPISDELMEQSSADGQVYRVQYFERARFEHHPALAGTPYEVQLGHLGGEQYAAKHPGGRPPGGPGQVCFAETGRCVRSDFHAYWQRHGGLSQFGYPLSDEFDEVNAANGRAYRVQYFERARFEHHPENTGTDHEILLGHLGRDALVARYPNALTPGYFFTLAPGSALPDGATCAARVRRSGWEPRPENAATNRAPGAPPALPPWSGHDSRANAELLPRIDGAFAGTTDEILQWAACKWGLDEDIARAVAVQESNWVQATGGDVSDRPEHCAPGYGAPCPTSFGLMQVRWTIWSGTFPHARDSTAFNVDYALGVFRACYEGHTTWLHGFTGSYRAGDEWGCLGLWYAGRWYTPQADDYIAKVRRHLHAQTWRSWPDASGQPR
jgi:autotransporter family porin